jgi:hypothetical protein
MYTPLPEFHPEYQQPDKRWEDDGELDRLNLLQRSYGAVQSSAQAQASRNT